MIPMIQILSELIQEKIETWKEKALIGKFLGGCPRERNLVWWNQGPWKPKGHYDLQQGEKGFLTIIFFNQEDQDRVLEDGP